jgi:predicted RNA-binding protein with PUA-like domain
MIGVRTGNLEDRAMWLVKTEPSAYGYGDLEREGRTTWDGVKNPVALKNLKAMRTGDLAIVYHTGDERAAVGVAEVVRAAYPDPKAGDPRLVVVDLRAVARLEAPVGLSEIKSMAVFAGSPLLRQGRLSVVPLTAPQWRALAGSVRR